MRWGFLLPVLALVTGCATDGALTTSTPEPPIKAASGITPPLTTASVPAAVTQAAAPPPVARAQPVVSPPAGGPAAPVALSRAQTAAIEDAMWRVIEDPAWVKVGPVNAGVANGVTVVCGTVKSRNSFGVFSKDTPFRGEFRGKEFKTAGVGGQNAAAALAACDKAGLPISQQG